MKSVNSSTNKSPARLLKVAAALLITAQISACAQGPSGSSADLAQAADRSVGCTSFEDEFWDGLHKFTLDKKTFPPASEVKEAFQKELTEGRLKSLSESDRRRIADMMTELYQLLAVDSVEQLSVDHNDHDKKLETLTALELGDRTTEERSAIQDKIRAKFAEIEQIVAASGDVPECAPETVLGEPMAEPKAGTQLAYWKKNLHPAVFGGYKALATSYQSCSAGSKTPMATSTAGVQGISVIGTHPNGVGMKRVVSNVDALLRSHFYMKSAKRPSASCFNVNANPLIYDYGGKPSTGAGADSTFNYFKDAGTGTSALGIDCSGYIYSALATAGLKVKKSGRMKAVGVHGINARMYMNPQQNGLTCFDYVRFSGQSTIKPGDLLASGGHIVMVEKVGTDPLGIGDIKRASDCNASNISVKRFNFSILQSAPVKNGMGINRYRAAEYLSGEGQGSMSEAMVQHAINACKARTSNSTVKSVNSYANLVRHLGTPECKDRPIKLEKEECIASCPATTAALGEEI